MTKINLKKFKNALENTRGIKTLIAKRLGVTRKALYDYLDRSKEARELYEEEASRTQDLAESKLNQKIKEGNMKAIKIALLKHKRGRERGYGNRLELQHSGEMEITHKDIQEAMKEVNDEAEKRNKEMDKE